MSNAHLEVRLQVNLIGMGREQTAVVAVRVKVVHV